MQFVETSLAGAWLIELDRLSDERGSFARTFSEDEFADHGLPVRFPQCSLSMNTNAGTLRGLHFNAEPHGEGKLVRCVRGAIHDVIVDLRAGSSTQFQWVGVDLTADNGLALFVGAGFAHGFLTLSPASDVYYHIDLPYNAGAARGIRWDDPAVGVSWPAIPTTMSTRDATYPDLVLAEFDLTTWPW